MKKEENIALLGLFFINVFLFIPYFINPTQLTRLDNDLGRTYIPIFSFIGTSLRNYLQIPLWRPEQMMGEPFLANPLSTLLYPLNLIFALIPTNFASILYIFIHFQIALVSTFYLIKSYKLTTHLAFAAAVFYAYSTKMLVHLEAGHVTMIAAFAYFPILLLSTRSLLQKTTFKNVVLAAISLLFMFITYTTIFYYALIFIGIYFVYKISQERITSKIILNKLKPLVLFLTLFLCLGAAAIIPQIQFGSYSSRSQMKFEDVAIPIWNLKMFVTSLVFPYKDLTKFNHEAFLYLGFVPLVFALLGFLTLKRFQKIFLGLISTLTLLFVAGRSTPVFKIAYEFLPILKYTRVTTRLWFAVDLVVVVLAAFGLSKIKNVKLIYIATILYLLEATFIFHKRIEQIKPLSFENINLYEYIDRDKDVFRVYCTTYCFNPQLTSKYKIELLNGETPIQSKSFVDFLQLAGNYTYNNFAVIFPPYQVWQVENKPQPNAKLLGDANVKYIASTYELTSKEFEYLNKFDKVYLYKNSKFQNRVKIDNSDKVAQITAMTPNIIDVSIEKSNKPQTLTISQNYYPGWFAYVDGQKYEVTQKDSVFQSVNIPPNAKRVQLKYQPQILLSGKVITLGSLLFIIMYFLYIKRRTGW